MAVTSLDATTALIIADLQHALPVIELLNHREA